MTKVYGFLYAQTGDDDQPLVYIPADGSKAEFATLNQVPKEVQDVMVSQADTLNLTPIGAVVDIESN